MSDTRYFHAAYAELVRPGMRQLGANRTHWRPYRVVPEPTPDKLDHMVASLHKSGFEAASGIQVGLGAFIGVEPNRHSPDEIDFAVTTAAQGTPRD